LFKSLFNKKVSIEQELIINIFTEKLPKNSYARISLEAFARGIRNIGDECNIIDSLEYKECDIAVIFGDVRDAPSKKKRMRLKAEVIGRHRGKGLIVIDTPVLTRPYDKNEKYRRVGIDSLFADTGKFNNQNSLCDRWKILSEKFGIKIQEKEKEKKGDNIYILLQRFYDASLRGSQRLRPKKYFAWLDSVIKELENETDRKIIIRPHPGSLNAKEELDLIENFKLKIDNNKIFDYEQKALFDVLDDAFATICYNSGSAIDSLLYGVPNITYDSGSHAYTVANNNCKDIESIVMPDISQWLCDLGYVDWSIYDLEQGLAWKHLKKEVLKYI